MYSSLKNIQILIALLKKNDIKNIVMSPGGCNMEFVRSIEYDGSFKCFSVVDERSAAFFAMGIAQSVKEPVAMLCTSGTAVCNYLSGVTEAFYQRVPLVVITADRNPYLYNQLETQKIQQIGIFDDVCKKSVSLPVVHNDEDFWYCERLVNEALLELDHHGKGPVHINIPTAVLDIPSDCNVKQLPDVQQIQRVILNKNSAVLENKIKQLSSVKKILVVFGQDRPYDSSACRNVHSFREKYNCVLSVENLSNMPLEDALITYPVTEVSSLDDLKMLKPDIVITVGNNVSAARIKGFLRSQRRSFQHWCVDETGNVKDVFKSLTTIFECTPSEFFSCFGMNELVESKNDFVYESSWKKVLGSIKHDEFPFSNMYVAQELSKVLPPDSLLHLGILNSTRQMQFQKIDKSIEVFSNIGALGIDGSMSTFMGQAAVSEKLCFLLLGDLSFFYDMNSVWIRHLQNNVRIVMVNNGGGGEFHFSCGKESFPNIDAHVAVRHEACAKAWVESLGFRYLAAANKQELIDVLSILPNDSDVPVFVEVYTEMVNDAESMRNFYKANKNENLKSKGLHVAQNVARKTLGNQTTDQVKGIIKKMVKRN